VQPPAYSIAELVRIGPLSRSTIYAEIVAGRLRAVKAGRRTLILAISRTCRALALSWGPTQPRRSNSRARTQNRRSRTLRAPFRANSRSSCMWHTTSSPECRLRRPHLRHRTERISSRLLRDLRTTLQSNFEEAGLAGSAEERHVAVEDAVDQARLALASTSR
jgi:hypothetical protein